LPENDEADAAAGAPAALPVDVATPVVKDIVEWDEYTGRFEAVDRVDLRARVSGYLESVHFRDGQMVNEGDLLFVIDPRPFVAALDQAKAELERAQAQLELADLDLSRGESLLRTRNISRESVDERRAAKKEALASVAEATASVRAAELDLEFTRIMAPVSGRISDRKVDVGNLVIGGSIGSTPLATIVSLDPIYFVFDASEADFLRYVRLSFGGERPSSRDTANPVYVRLMDETEWTRRGTMNFVDNELNRDTGTIRGRAVFDNSDNFLSPGVFGRLRLLGSSRHEAILVPDAAVLSDQSRKIVMTVDAEDMVVPKVVTLGPIVDGLRVIRSGLTPEDRVVINGVQRARPGGKVLARAADIGAEGPALDIVPD